MPPSPLAYPVVSELLDRISRNMIGRKVPPDDYGNLAASAMTPLLLELPPDRIPLGLREVAILAHPAATELRALIALRGIDLETARRALADRPVREMGVDGLPPVDASLLPPAELPLWT